MRLALLVAVALLSACAGARAQAPDAHVPPFARDPL